MIPPLPNSFGENSYVNLWFRRDALRALSGNDIKREAHSVVSALIREAESNTGAGGAGEPVPSGFHTQTGRLDRRVVGRQATEEGSSGSKAPRTSSSSSSSSIDAQTLSSRRRHPRVITGIFPPETDENDRFREGSKAGAATEAANATGRIRGTVPGTEAVVAYRARLRLCSLVLHFRGKGLRPGAFLFLAVRERTPVCGGDGFSRTRSGARSGGLVTTEAAAAVAAAATTTRVEGGVAGGPVVPRRERGDGFTGEGGGEGGGAQAISGGQEGGGGGVESSSSGEKCRDAKATETREGGEPTARTDSGGRGGDARCAASGGDENGATELWITDESVPLLPVLCDRWGEAWSAAAADARLSSTEAPKSAAGASRPTGRPRAGSTEGTLAAPAPAPAPATTGAPEGEISDEEEGTPSGHHPSPAALTLRVMPSGRSPLPPLCCGLCGSSWETDSFGRSYRVYHLAVANNASLVWYLQKRFSEFLALHEALSGRGGGGEFGSEIIPKGRWGGMIYGVVSARG